MLVCNVVVHFFSGEVQFCQAVCRSLGEYEIETKQGKTIKMCDYASAGKIWDDLEERRITAWL